jgi:hypothetical protein
MQNTSLGNDRETAWQSLSDFVYVTLTNIGQRATELRAKGRVEAMTTVEIRRLLVAEMKADDPPAGNSVRTHTPKRHASDRTLVVAAVASLWLLLGGVFISKVVIPTRPDEPRTTAPSREPATRYHGWLAYAQGLLGSSFEQATAPLHEGGHGGEETA